MNLEQEYKKILSKIKIEGIYRNDRTGVGSYSLFNQSLNWNLSSNKFPMFTGKKIFKKIFETEFKWFINGETNIQRFKDAGVKIWNEWADENGDLGPVYGHQLLNYNSEGVNQLENVISSLKSNPDSRRHIISLWNPLQIKDMALPPCYHYFQFFVENNKLNMFVVQRSADMFLGVPYDIALFSRLLLYVAAKTNLSPCKINLNMIDCHIYSNQIKQVETYIKNDLFELPDYKYNTLEDRLEIFNYKSNTAIKAKVAV